jgi:tetratricopeptide (TPR) repeat protein
MSHNHDGSCGCSGDPLEHEREFADAIRRQAQGYLNKEQLPLARAMFAASRAVLTARGGIIGEKGVWLLVAEAHIPEVEGDRLQALKEHEAALALSEKELGGEHLATGVCLFNVADTLMNLDRPKDAKPLFERAQRILKKVAVDQKDTDEFLSHYADEISSAAQKGFELAKQKLGG